MSEVENPEDVVIRTTTRIKQLKEALDRGYFVLFAEGDPDFPNGVKLPFPKSWKTQIQKCIKKLEEKRLKALGVK